MREAERGDKNIGALCHSHGISEQSFYRWRHKYTGMTAADVRRLRELEREHARLKRLNTERGLEIDVLKGFPA